LIATPTYEVWLLGWTPGQSVGLHDHGGANGAFVIVDGILTETRATEPHSRRSPTLTRRTLSTGDVAVIEAGDVHDVANHSTALATSIHAYSKPLRSMNFYDASEPHSRAQRISTMLVEHQPPVLTVLDD
jgi:predicted metal-dependent enzyme (double-stranded beta helix superfamily)